MFFKRILKKIKTLKRLIVKRYFRYRTLRLLKTKWQPCILCGNDKDFEILYEEDRFKIPVKTQKCKECGLVSINPKPTKDFINKFYSSSMYRGLYKGFIKASSSFQEEDQSMRKALINTEFLKSINPKESFYLLDFGCSEASFLNEAKRYFPRGQFYGIEPGENFSDFNKNKKIRIYKSLSQIPENIRFNFITAWHVIEHLEDPILILSQLRDILKDDGRIIIEVPNLNKYRSIKNIHLGHLFHFTPDTIGKISKKAGLSVESIQEKFLVDSDFGMKIILKKILI